MALDARQLADHHFPPALEAQIGGSVARLSTAERRRIHEGGAVTKLLDSDVTKEVAVFGVIWIDAPVRRLVESYKNIEKHETGEGFHRTRRLGTPPRVEDFAEVRLPAGDLEDLRACRPGRCELQLTEYAANLMKREVDWTAPDADAAAEQVLRRWLADLVTGYLEGGNDRLPVYHDASTTVPVAREFRTLVDHSVSLVPYPELVRYLLDFPRATLPGATSFLYWQEASFGLKRTTHISHLVIAEREHETVMLSKMLFATHYFWTALDVRVLIPDPARGPGFWFVTASRTRLDGLSGFTGFFVRRRVRSQVQDGTMKILLTTKRKLEAERVAQEGHGQGQRAEGQGQKAGTN